MGKQAILEIEDCDKDLVLAGKIVGSSFDDAYEAKFLVERIW